MSAALELYQLAAFAAAIVAVAMPAIAVGAIADFLASKGL